MLDMQALQAYSVGMQYTIRDIPDEVDKALRAKAKAEGKSLNQTTVEVLTAAVGIGQAKRKYRDLSGIVGSLIRDPEFDRVMEEQERIDPEVWR
jgi:plasmid stability protein